MGIRAAGRAWLTALAFSSCAGFAAADERGEYLATIMDCGGCHTPGYLMGQPDMERYLGGGDVGFQVPGAGIFYPPNLTSDETGLGDWTEDQIIAAIRTGVRPDGRVLSPVMPWMNYAALSDEDAYALARYLKSTAPIDNQVPGPIGPDQPPPGPYMTVVLPH